MLRILPEIVLTVLCLVTFLPTNSAQAGDEAAMQFTDDFRTIERLQTVDNVAQRRDFARIVTRPDVRINRPTPEDYKDSTTGSTIGYGWFPAIIRLHNGDLLCFYREGAEHGMKDLEARAVVSRSTDGGRSWQPAQVIMQQDQWGISPMYPTQTRDGNIFVNLRMIKVAGDGKGQWKHTTMCSTDNGHSWQQAAPASYQPGPEMSNGEMLWLSGTSGGPYTSVRATLTSRLVDGELDWSEKRAHPELGPTSDEWTVTETQNPGELVCMMRQQQHSHCYATGKSYDYGKTWTQWRESNVYMGPIPTRPRLHTMPDGRVIFTYGQRWIGRTFAVVSKDNGESWDVAHRQTILHSPREYHNVWDSHYTDIARAEGNIWIGVDYISSPRTAQQRGIYGTFIDARYFDDAFEGMMLKQIGSPITSKTVGYWKFDELDGEFANDSVSSNFGEIHGAQRVSGRLGNALDFDGEDNYVMVYDDPTVRLPRYFTLEAWINTRDATKEQTILSKPPAYSLVLREGKPVLEIGLGAATADLEQPLESNRWYHIAAVFGMRASYSRVTFFVNGQEVSNMRPARGGSDYYPTSYLEAASQNDMEIGGGPLMFQEWHRKNESADNLVIGMDNDLQSRAFDGMIDDVIIHGSALMPEQIQASYSRAYVGQGIMTSRPITKSADAHWATFAAQVTEPAGTQIRFSIINPQGELLGEDLASGADLSGLDAPEIVLKAELTTIDEGQSPILHNWSVGTTGPGKPAVVQKPFPAQSARQAGAEEHPPEEHVIF